MEIQVENVIRQNVIDTKAGKKMGFSQAVCSFDEKIYLTTIFSKGVSLPSLKKGDKIKCNLIECKKGEMLSFLTVGIN